VESQQQISDLRKAELDQYDKFITLSDEYVKVKEQVKKEQFKRKPNPTLSMKMTQIGTQVNLVVDNFRSTEAKLAQLEGRPARTITFMSPTIPSVSNTQARPF